MEVLAISSTEREQLITITPQLQDLVARKNWLAGALLVYCPHTTAAITVNESADPDVRKDMVSFMRGLVPPLPAFRHREGNSDAHIKSSMFGAHCLLIVEHGALQLGTWQNVYFCEWDGPRERSVWVQFLPA